MKKNTKKRNLVVAVVACIWAATAVCVLDVSLRSYPAPLSEQERFSQVVVERVDIALDDIKSVEAMTPWSGSEYILFCTDIATPRPLDGWAVEPREGEPGCYEVMSAEAARRLSEQEAERREYERLEPVRYVLGESLKHSQLREVSDSFYVVILPAYEANRLLRDPAFAARAADAELTPLVLDPIADMGMDSAAFGQPVLAIAFDLSDVEGAA